MAACIVQKQPKNQAFTLIELLVVIAIIAVLMGILMPALSAVKRQAQGAACQAQLKQWHLCYTLYTDDHEGRFPPFFGGTVETTFMESLRKYYNDINKMRTCPVASKVSTDVPTGLQPLSYFGKTLSAWQIDPSAEWLDDQDWGIGSYGENSWIRGPSSRENGQNWASTARIKHPSEVPLLGDARWNNAWPDNGPVPAFSEDETVAYSINNWSTMACYAMRRHKKGINMALADGAVRQISAEGLWLLKWNRTFEKQEDMILGNQ
ncbi:MAG: type II secretion system GspH family protein [Phycisphaerae bacterium]|nr:type II secretion system GspH family protein [Phycisphaerae bacterium]